MTRVGSQKNIPHWNFSRYKNSNGEYSFYDLRRIRITNLNLFLLTSGTNLNFCEKMRVR